MGKINGRTKKPVSRKPNKPKTLYRTFYDAYKNAHVDVASDTVELIVPELWNELKASGDLQIKARMQINQWNAKAARLLSKHDKIWSDFRINSTPGTKALQTTGTGTKKNQDESALEAIVIEADSPDESLHDDLFIEGIGSAEISEDPLQDNHPNPELQADVGVISAKQKPRTPAQDGKRKEIAALQQDISYLAIKKGRGTATDKEKEDFDEKTKMLKKCQKSLRNLTQTAIRQRKSRALRKVVYKNNPDIPERLGEKKTKGKLRIEESQPELMKAIIDIAMYGSAAEDRRRSGILRTAKTLDDLREALEVKGYQVTRTALYHRLLPKRSNSAEAMRHVVTAPVKLIRATNDAHKEHGDTLFCRASIMYLEEIASLLGQSQVIFISQDDKARVPIGMTAANKQSPVLMHVDYLVRLPDHDWVVADRHKLIPSVYGLMKIKSNPSAIGSPTNVGYTGPTFIAIRSGKHSSSTALSHAKDLDSLLELNDAFEFTRCASGDVKPVIIITVDGGPDENPRYEKVINCAVRHFKKYDLDAIFVATNAPGRSAFNRVERRMTPLSRELSGVILPHDLCGSHLDERRRTVDLELEKQNFRHAGLALAELWNKVVLDEFNTTAVYVDPEESTIEEPSAESPQWKARHVREAHYFLQVVKCDDRNCCAEPRGNYFKLLKQFIPAPLCINPETLQLSDNADNNLRFPSLFLRLSLDDTSFRNSKGKIPFDVCCPSVQEFLEKRTCKHCGIYTGSQKSLTSHKRACTTENPTLDSTDESTLNQRRNNRPVKLLSQREGEKMIAWTSRLNDEHIDWFENHELENVQFEQESRVVIQGDPELFPIINIDDHMSCIWELDKTKKE